MSYMTARISFLDKRERMAIRSKNQSRDVAEHIAKNKRSV